MRALTLWQPWAGAMALGIKTIETRGWWMEYRGDLCIHAGAHKITQEDWDCLPYGTRRDANAAAIALCQLRSAILCVVEVWDCLLTDRINREFIHRGEPVEEEVERSLGNYSPGRYGILTRNLRVLRRPVPCKGKQGLWILTPELEAAVLNEIV